MSAAKTDALVLSVLNCESVILQNKKLEDIALIYSFWPRAKQEEYARTIMTAVNQHDFLVETLEKLMVAFQKKAWEQPESIHWREANDAIAQARTAVFLARA